MTSLAIIKDHVITKSCVTIKRFIRPKRTYIQKTSLTCFIAYIYSIPMPYIFRNTRARDREDKIFIDFRRYVKYAAKQSNVYVR